MSDTTDQVSALAEQSYKWGFETDIAMDVAPRGLNTDIIRLISDKKGEPRWMLDWRLKANWPVARRPGCLEQMRSVVGNGLILLCRVPALQSGPRRTPELLLGGASSFEAKCCELLPPTLNVFARCPGIAHRVLSGVRGCVLRAG